LFQHLGLTNGPLLPILFLAPLCAELDNPLQG